MAIHLVGVVLAVPDSVAALLGRNDFVPFGAFERVAQLNIRNHVILGTLAPFRIAINHTKRNECFVRRKDPLFSPENMHTSRFIRSAEIRKVASLFEEKFSYGDSSLAVFFVFTVIAVLQSIANLYIHRVSSIIFDEYFVLVHTFRS